MQDIFSIVSTTTLNKSPTINITAENQDLLNVMVVDDKGFLYKTPLSSFKQFLNPTSLIQLLNIITENTLLGKSGNTSGKVQKISLGEMFSIDESNKLINCDVNIESIDFTGTPFKGVYPSIKLKDNIISKQKIKDLIPGKILGRYSPGNKEIEEINISEDFEISGNQLNLVNIDNITETGFVINNKSDDFFAEINHIYFINNTKSTKVYCQMPGGEIGDKFIIINLSNNPIYLFFTDIIYYMNPFNCKTAFFVRDDENKFYNLSFTPLVEQSSFGFNNYTQLNNLLQINNNN